MSGAAPALDGANSLYFITGNGSFSADTGGTEYSDSFLRLQPGLAFLNSGAAHSRDFFTPSNQDNLDANDTDVGSGGLMLLPDAVGSAAHPHLMVGCGKQGMIYLVDRDNLGGFSLSADNVVQEFGSDGTWSSPAYWNGAIYYQGSGGALKRFPISSGQVNTGAVIQSGDGSGFPGCTPTISANGTGSGIVWTVQSDAYNSNGPAILRAHAATSPATELYDSAQVSGRDAPGAAVKFAVPTVANGKVYVGAQGQVSVYGLATFTATPVIHDSGQGYVGDTVTLTDATPGASIYYTIDGTPPTLSSIPYSQPFSVSACETIQAVAVSPGDAPSAVASQFFGMQGVTGSGDGLAVTYFTGTNLDATAGPTVTGINPAVDFTLGTFPDGAIGQTNFSARWVGQVQPKFTDTYTFYFVADDGIRLWVNGQELVNAWIAQGATEYSGTIALQAGQKYDIKVEYYQGGGGADAHLSWSSGCQNKQIIPQSQLYTGVPTALTATPGDSQVTLSWSAPLHATSYVVKRSTTQGGPYTTLMPATPITAASFTDTGLTNGTKYYYVVDAAGAGSTPGDSNEASATPVAAPPPMHARLLWNKTDGTASLWAIARDSSMTHTEYGPFAGWTAKSVSSAPDGSAHLLWTNANGQASVWNVATNGSYTSAQYGPFSGYHAVSLSTGGDGKTHLLWDKTDGTASLWTVNTATGAYTYTTYGPYSGYTARAVASGATVTDLLWTKADGTASGYRISPNGALQYQIFGPYKNWTPVTLSVGPDDGAHLLWNNTSGMTSLWSADFATGNFADAEFGPVAGWSAKGLAIGPDEVAHLLWGKADGTTALWAVNADNSYTYALYGPFKGWTAVAVSAGR